MPCQEPSLKGETSPLLAFDPRARVWESLSRKWAQKKKFAMGGGPRFQHVQLYLISRTVLLNYNTCQVDQAVNIKGWLTWQCRQCPAIMAMRKLSLKTMGWLAIPAHLSILLESLSKESNQVTATIMCTITQGMIISKETAFEIRQWSQHWVHVLVDTM